MKNSAKKTGFISQNHHFIRCTVNLTHRSIKTEQITCRNLEDVLGGFARAFQLLEKYDVSDAYSPHNPLIVNTGILTGTNVMTGLRTYFSAYSPLKASSRGLPSTMWSAASGKFGSKLRWTGIDELIFEGKSEVPVLLELRQTGNGPAISLVSAENALLGLACYEKIRWLQQRYEKSHFAVIGPAGEHFDQCYFGAVGLSTENLLKTGDDKCRWAGRGGMGSVMGSKNLIGIIVQATDPKEKPTPEIRELNKHIVSGPGSRKYREKKKGGLGGTWYNYEALEKFHFVPQDNFRPKGDNTPKLMFRKTVERQYMIKAENCFKCAIACHKNVYEKQSDGNRGKFLAKFDYEPLNLLSTNLGIHDPSQAAVLVSLCDKLGMDSISLGATIAYVLDYNQRHHSTPICNGAEFGDFEKIKELVILTGKGQLPAIGHGVKRLSESLGDTGYAMHVKGLELPAYLPDTNPGYPWAIAGGHMSMGTYMLYALEGDTSIDYWKRAITERGINQIRDDLIGICKFSMLNVDEVIDVLKKVCGLDITSDELNDAVSRSFARALRLERKQGYRREEYTLPSQVFDNPNPALRREPFITRDFFSRLSDEVWDFFEKEMKRL